MIVKNLQELYQFFKNNQPIIAIDYGLKKIGIAISNPEWTIALPLTIINESKKSLQIKAILNLIIHYKASIIVMGLPLNMNGEIGPQAQIVLEFLNELAKLTDLPIYLQDERLSSKTANNMLKIFGKKRKERNHNDDIIAASLILETTLQSIKNARFSEQV